MGTLWEIYALIFYPFLFFLLHVSTTNLHKAPPRIIYSSVFQRERLCLVMEMSFAK